MRRRGTGSGSDASLAGRISVAFGHPDGAITSTSPCALARPSLHVYGVPSPTPQLRIVTATSKIRARKPSNLAKLDTAPSASEPCDVRHFLFRDSVCGISIRRYFAMPGKAYRNINNLKKPLKSSRPSPSRGIHFCRVFDIPPKTLNLTHARRIYLAPSVSSSRALALTRSLPSTLASPQRSFTELTSYFEWHQRVFWTGPGPSDSLK
ncbi:hypothetical protein D9611_005408 [Ephemerocybe angulata]|uniref:Uncharacterized protein n=1 Tax=Ephemerocybe angulata TaxID=980116 RepID=A0A8H5FDL4_9AGAR|nr:hypothetical protein D9611_005408 [Tulosesus angulatus]